jgi:thiol-disulfide isomerase/thioredoxin
MNVSQLFSRLHLRVESRLPPFVGATGWLNTEPLTTTVLHGKVVIVQFWTYTCINWFRTLPHIRAWADTFADKGLVGVGVHAPEFGVEHARLYQLLRQSGHITDRVFELEFFDPGAAALCFTFG